MRTALPLIAAMLWWSQASAADPERAAPGVKPGVETRTQKASVPAWLRDRDARLASSALRADPDAPSTGAECPVNSKVYCGDDLPYCCYDPTNKVYYCALDIQHCTR